MQLRIQTDGVLAALAEYGKKTESALAAAAAAAAAGMEDYAKQNRPWTDRTGMARSTLAGVWEMDGDRLSVGVEGHMPYSVFLELGYGGRYSILSPTVHHFAPDALLRFADAINGMK